MAKINETAQWVDDVNLIARGEKVEGGRDGSINIQAKRLADRTAFLKEKMESVSEEDLNNVKAAKSFLIGGILLTVRDEIIYGNYRMVWTGEFPKEIPAGSTPEETGGIGAGAWAYTSDAAVRNDLASTGDASGGRMMGLSGGGVVQDAIWFKTPEMFKAKGNGVDDDSAALQDAADWLCAASYRKLIFNPGKIYRVAAPVSFTFASGVIGCEIDMCGFIKPDAGIGDAFSFHGLIGGKLKLSVIGNGVTEDSGIPNYHQADPEGAQQAFVIDATRSSVLDIVGYGYAGRVLRTKSTTTKPKTSFLDIHIRTGDVSTNSPMGRCGQAMFLEGGDNAIGIIQKAQTNWDVYGSVLSRIADISIGYWEAGAGTKNPGITFSGCGTGHIDTLAVGVSAQAYPCVRVEDYGTTPTSKLHFQRLFGVSGSSTLQIVGTTTSNTARKPVSIGSLFSYNTKESAVVLNNISNVSINDMTIDAAASYGIYFEGACRNIRVDNAYFMNLQNPSIHTSEGADISDIFINNSRFLSISTTALVIDLYQGTVGKVTFRDCVVYATHNAIALQASNQVSILGGNWSAATTLFPNSRPRLIRDTQSPVVQTRGSSNFPSGTVSGATVQITHGLGVTPTDIDLRFVQAAGLPGPASLILTETTETTFTVTYLGSALTAQVNFRWFANSHIA